MGGKYRVVQIQYNGDQRRSSEDTNAPLREHLAGLKLWRNHFLAGIQQIKARVNRTTECDFTVSELMREEHRSRTWASGIVYALITDRIMV